MLPYLHRTFALLCSFVLIFNLTLATDHPLPDLNFSPPLSPSSEGVDPRVKSRINDKTVGNDVQSLHKTHSIQKSKSSLPHSLTHQHRDLQQSYPRQKKMKSNERNIHENKYSQNADNLTETSKIGRQREIWRRAQKKRREKRTIEERKNLTLKTSERYLDRMSKAVSLKKFCKRLGNFFGSDLSFVLFCVFFPHLFIRKSDGTVKREEERKARNQRRYMQNLKQRRLKFASNQGPTSTNRKQG